MTRNQLHHEILNDLAHGRTTLASTYLDYLLNDLKIPLENILKIIERRFDIPRQIILRTLISL